MTIRLLNTKPKVSCIFAFKAMRMGEFEQLDRLLKFIIESSPADYEIHKFLTECNKKSPDIIDVSTSAILSKLTKDGYIAYGFVEEVDTYFYNATFEGIVFSKQGGYVGQNNRQNAALIKEIKNDHQAKVNRQLILWLTLLIALGTSIAAWYYSQQIWLFYHPLPCH